MSSTGIHLASKHHIQGDVCIVNAEITPTTKSLACILGLLGGFSALMLQPTTPTNIPGVSGHFNTTTLIGINICKYNPGPFSLLSTLSGLFHFLPICCFHLVSPHLYLYL